MKRLLCIGALILVFTWSTSALADTTLNLTGDVTTLNVTNETLEVPEVLYVVHVTPLFNGDGYRSQSYLDYSPAGAQQISSKPRSSDYYSAVWEMR